jgi:hypothetical protein
MGRVMAEPGRGPHDKLSKALEGIGKLKGDKIEEKRKNFPCNQTALQAVVSCLHAGPSWGFPGDENLQAPLEQDMKQIMRLTEQLGNQPGAVRIGQGSEGLKQLLTRFFLNPFAQSTRERPRTFSHGCSRRCDGARGGIDTIG